MASRTIADAAAAALPAGFRHPHASDEARRIAERGLILRTQVGSGVHGTSIAGQDDRDEMGICLEPPEFDVVVYSAGKWARLAVTGNPTVLLVLFVPDEDLVFRNDAGVELVDNAERFVSRQAADRFLGYLQSQRAAMTGEVGAHTNRPELVAVHTLPVPEPGRAYLRSIRRGEVPLDEVVAAIDDAQAHLVRLRGSPTVPEQPDRQWVDCWLHRSQLAYWADLGGTT